MHRNTSNIDFTFFLNQKVTEIIEINSKPTGIILEKANLIIECPYRLRNFDGIVVGLSDFLYAQDMYTYKNMEKILVGKVIKNILLFEDVADLVIEFDSNTYLELFHDSNYFEGWQLMGSDGFHLFSIPGGSYSYTN